MDRLVQQMEFGSGVSQEEVDHRLRNELHLAVYWLATQQSVHVTSEPEYEELPSVHGLRSRRVSVEIQTQPRARLSPDGRRRISESVKAWNARQPKEWKQERARKGAAGRNAVMGYPLPISEPRVRKAKRPALTVDEVAFWVTQAWNKSNPLFRSWRARKAALAMHRQGKTNTKAASAAFKAKFTADEERAEYMRALARSAWADSDVSVTSPSS